MLDASQVAIVAYEFDGSLYCHRCTRKMVQNDVLWFRAGQGLDDLYTVDGEPIDPVSRFDVQEMWSSVCHECGHIYLATCDGCGSDIE